MPTKFDGPVSSSGLHPRGDGASRRAIAPGDTVMIDVVTCVNGYQADNARTFVVGEPSDDAARAHDFCRAALRELEKRLRPGAAPSAVYAEVAKWAADRGEPDGFMGYGANRVGFFGHGVGLELDEWPVIAPRFDAPIEVGMVVALEPKALSMKHGPAGIENTYLVTGGGPVPLCEAPEEIVDLS
jgi:Xaa-Pro aminopeptidase